MMESSKVTRSSGNSGSPPGLGKVFGRGALATQTHPSRLCRDEQPAGSWLGHFHLCRHLDGDALQLSLWKCLSPATLQCSPTTLYNRFLSLQRNEADDTSLILREFMQLCWVLANTVVSFWSKRGGSGECPTEKNSSLYSFIDTGDKGRGTWFCRHEFNWAVLIPRKRMWRAPQPITRKELDVTFLAYWLSSSPAQVYQLHKPGNRGWHKNSIWNWLNFCRKHVPRYIFHDDLWLSWEKNYFLWPAPRMCWWWKALSSNCKKGSSWNFIGFINANLLINADFSQWLEIPVSPHWLLWWLVLCVSLAGV